MKTEFLIVPFLLAASVLLGACAATPRLREEGPVVKDLSRYSSVQVIIEASDDIPSTKRLCPTSAALLKTFLGNVKALGKYASVGVEASGGEVSEVWLRITDLSYVHGAERGVVGVTAGRAVLKVAMTLQDKQTGAVLGTVTAGHCSSHAQGVFSPTTGREVTAIAKELSSRL